MLVSAFSYDLPDDLIAQHPPAVRGASRMLRLDRQTGAWQDRMFADLPSLLLPGDLLVLNDTRVLPSRLFATRAGLRTQAGSPQPAGLIEVVLTERIGGGEQLLWKALVRPAKKVQRGETLLFASGVGGEPVLRAEVVGVGEFGERTLQFAPVENIVAALERIGYLPLPPYIRRGRAEPNTGEDRERYQTVYAQPLAASTKGLTGASVDGAPQLGSAAAPTAGLHFTRDLLAAVEARGVEVARLTLHVGLGTFQPVRAERTEFVRLHAEGYTLPAETAHSLNRAWEEKRRIVAVGTTTTRTLEHVARAFEAKWGALGPAAPLRLEPHSGTTSLFLSPGPEGDDRFRLVDGLLTNFHLPQSTLLMLVSAFAGRDRVLAAYRHAVEQRYRFFSYGDCMLVL